MLLLSLGIHPGWYLGSFILLLLTYWRTDRSQVPLYLSNTVTAKAVAGLVPLQSRQFLDIGCGHGGLLRRVALQHPCCNFVGIEHAPIPWLLGRMLGALRTNVDVRYGDFWRMPIAGFDVVYAFLSPVPMPRLWAKACEEMKEGSLLISNSFEVPGVKPARVLQLDDARRTRLLIYKVPGRR
jgi:SAM-dependent methyltransferase